MTLDDPRLLDKNRDTPTTDAYARGYIAGRLSLSDELEQVKTLLANLVADYPVTAAGQSFQAARDYLEEGE